MKNISQRPARFFALATSCGFVFGLSLTVAAATADVTCTIAAGTLLNPVSPRLFGTNIEWFNRGNGLVTANGALDTNLLTTAAQQGISSVRFPGGILSDFYHWRNGVGPAGARPVAAHGADPGYEPDVFGTPELLTTCAAINATPLITANVGSGTPAEAAAWVDYCNNPQNAQRLADGISPSSRVPVWELGNELYLNGSAAEQAVALTPTNYAAKVLAFASAMRAADPSIQLMAIGTVQRDAYAATAYPNWTQTVLQACAAQIDYIAVHNAYFPGFFSSSDPAQQPGYRAFWAAPEAIDQELGRVEALINQYQQARPIGIAITEWGPLFGMLPDWVDHNKTMGSAVYVGRVLQVFLSHPKVQIANYFKMVDNTFMGWNSYLDQPKVPYYVIQLFSQHFGNTIVSTSTVSPTYSTPQIGYAPAESNVAEITTVSSIDTSKHKLYISLVSRAWNKNHYVQLNIGGFHPATTTGTLWQVYSPSVTDSNGPDILPALGLSYIDPSTTNRHIQIQAQSVNVNQPITVPPHSVVILELNGN